MPWGARKMQRERNPRSWNSQTSAWIALYGLLVFAPAARAEYAVLRSGQRLEISGWQRLGDSMRLDLAGGSVVVRADELVAIEPQEVFSAIQPALDVPYAE